MVVDIVVLVLIFMIGKEGWMVKMAMERETRCGDGKDEDALLPWSTSHQSCVQSHINIFQCNITCDNAMVGSKKVDSKLVLMLIHDRVIFDFVSTKHVNHTCYQCGW